jgi:aryl-alcohol dehydrogenase-like predicted oxidoreductase
VESRRIGSLEVSLAGLGGNNFGRRLDADRTREVVEAALEAGVTLFDTADIYGDGASETLLGQALGARRASVVITTKFGMREPSAGLSGGHPRWVARAAEESLRRLGSSYIDLYLLHQPDPATPIGETLRAMNQLLTQGKVREIGCSNFSAAQLAEADAAAKERGLRGFVCVQNEYNLLHREPERESCSRSAPPWG